MARLQVTAVGPNRLILTKFPQIENQASMTQFPLNASTDSATSSQFSSFWRGDPMRVCTLLLIVCCGTASHAQQFPLRLPVANVDTAVFSGPAETHYPTDRLAAGTEVEVHRLDPDNWCAIRPPRGSFCLVRASAVQRDAAAEGIGEISEAGTRCWVGTLLGEVHQPIWQVKLRAGERVRLLGEIPPAESDPADVGWLQIEPPSGEFRWIPLECFSSLDRETIVAASRGGGTDVQLAGGTYASELPTGEVQDSVEFTPAVRPREFSDPPAAEDDSEPLEWSNESGGMELAPPQESGTPRGRPPKRHSLAGDGGAWQPARRPIVQVAGEATADPWSHTPAIVNTPATTGGSVASNGNLPVLQPEVAVDWPWPAALQQIDLQLSAMVLEDPGRWDFQSLNREVLDARGRLSSPNDLAIADHLLNKIRRFQEIRAAQLASGPNALASFPRGQAPNAPTVLGFSGSQPVLDQRPLDVPVDLGATIQQGTQFDAFGWLNELVREDGSGQTSYVLQDEQGKITHLITPAPGVNLNRYLKSQVGLIGQKGYHKQFQLDHVTAERVVRLGSVKR